MATPIISTILKHDAKVASYKIALLRSINDVVLSGRDAMYKTATFLVQYFWGNASDMADSLGVLLLTWNQAFYRHGPFDFDELEKCISSNFELLSRYRKSNILDYTASDDEKIGHLFEQFLDALKIREGKRKGVRSPVGVAKALHRAAN
jgi:hypothetical protein